MLGAGDTYLLSMCSLRDEGPGASTEYTRANESLMIKAKPRENRKTFWREGGGADMCVCGKGCGHEIVEKGVRFLSFKIDLPTH